MLLYESPAEVNKLHCINHMLDSLIKTREDVFVWVTH